MRIAFEKANHNWMRVLSEPAHIPKIYLRFALRILQVAKSMKSAAMIDIRMQREGSLLKGIGFIVLDNYNIYVTRARANVEHKRVVDFMATPPIFHEHRAKPEEPALPNAWLSRPRQPYGSD